jgi:hypothetical protein
MRAAMNLLPALGKSLLGCEAREANRHPFGGGSGDAEQPSEVGEAVGSHDPEAGAESRAQISYERAAAPAGEKAGELRRSQRRSRSNRVRDTTVRSLTPVDAQVCRSRNARLAGTRSAAYV